MGRYRGRYGWVNGPSAKESYKTNAMRTFLTVKHLRVGAIVFLGAFVGPTVNADTVDDTKEKSTFVFLPLGHLFQPYLADPMRPSTGAQLARVSDTTVANTSNSRFILKLGGLIEIGQLSPAENPNGGWQFGIEAGFNGQFDRGQSQDNIGWDGLYGLVISYRRNDRWAFRTGIHHVSSHVGDEYAERNGRKRINYTREEIFGAAAWSFWPQWRTYAELGWAYDLLGKELQEEWRVQAGLEYERDEPVWGRNWRVYAATNLTAYQESDWNPDTAIQFGIHYRKSGRLLRIGLEFYDGRTLLGEFFQDSDRWISLGTWYDI
jgi:hypothetical protein